MRVQFETMAGRKERANQRRLEEENYEPVNIIVVDVTTNSLFLDPNIIPLSRHNH